MAKRVSPGERQQLRVLARQLISGSRQIPASDRTKRSFFEESIEADGRKISGHDLLSLYNQDLIVILDYPVSTTLDAGITRPEEILSQLLSKGDRRYEEFFVAQREVCRGIREG